MTDWDRLFEELYLKTYAPLQPEEDAEPLALGSMRLAGCQPPADVLDAACGFGRHSRALARAGYRVVGLDRSPVLLAEARRRSGGDGVSWVEGDYRRLPFEAESFDVVVNLFSSFGFFGDDGDSQVLGEFERVLRPGGALVLETLHRDRLMAVFHDQDWEELPDGAVRLDRRAFDPVNGVVESDLTYWPPGGEPMTLEYRLRLYTATELARMAAEAGFAETAFYGGPDGAPLTRESRLVLVARTA